MPYKHTLSQLDLHATIFTADTLRGVLQAVAEHRCADRAIAGG